MAAGAPNGAGSGGAAASDKLRAIMAAGFADPFSENCGHFSEVWTALFDAREGITEKLGEFLFGSEAGWDKAMNDTGSAVRSSLHSIGMGDWVTSLMGEAPERPPPHCQMGLRRAARGPFSVTFERAKDPARNRGPETVPPDLPTFGDAWLSAHHVIIDPEGLGHSDLRVTAAVGSHAGMVADVLKLVASELEALAWLASSEGDGETLKKFLREEAFPHLSEFSGRFVDVEALTFSKRTLPSGNVELSLDVPMDYVKAATFYPRMSELMCLFDPMLMYFKHPVTGAVFMEICLREGKQHISLFMRDGVPAWEGEGQKVPEAATWNKDGLFVTDVVIECSLVPLGLSIASIPFPEMRMRCIFEQNGHLQVTCMEAGEPVFKTVAAAVFDIDQLRQLLVEGFKFEVAHVPNEEGRSAVRAFGRLVFPTASVATIVSQWFQDFSLRQVRELDAPKAVSDFFVAVSRDAAALSAGAARK